MEKETDHFYPHIPGIGKTQFASGGQHVVKLANHELIPFGGGGALGEDCMDKTGVVLVLSLLIS